MNWPAENYSLGEPWELGADLKRGKLGKEESIYKGGSSTEKEVLGGGTLWRVYGRKSEVSYRRGTTTIQFGDDGGNGAGPPCGDVSRTLAPCILQ